MTDINALFARHLDGPATAFTIRAPGRVNLIGEHVDYNGGWVLPMAMPLSLWLRARPRADRVVRLYAANLEEWQEFSLDHMQAQGCWIDYAQGVAHELAGASVPLHGFEGVVASEIPVASGLSSSAAIEVAAGLAFLHLARQPMAPMALAQLCQAAENHFLGVQCGIMDQVAVAACHRDHALLLDCRSLDHQQIPLRLEEHSFVVTDSGAPRELAGSAYNERRAQCEAGLLLLQQHLPHLTSLRDVAPAEFAAHESALPLVTRRRVRHVVEEIARTRAAADALQQHRLAAFGAAMTASHQSLATLYEVSSPELDWLVAWAWAQPGVLGSRMTGAGFGGCTVTLLENSGVAAFVAQLPAAYRAAMGREARCWVCTAAEGARVVE